MAQKESHEVNAEGKSDMTRIGTRAEVWFSNVVASFARYVAERTLPGIRSDADAARCRHGSFNYAKENMQDAYSFLDRFEGLSAVDRGGKTKISFAQARAGVRRLQSWHDQLPGQEISRAEFRRIRQFSKACRSNGAAWLRKKPSILAAGCRRSGPMSALVKGWFAELGPRWKAENPASEIPLLVHVDCDTYAATVDVLELCRLCRAWCRPSF